MKHYAALLEEFGPVRSFDYPYMSAGRKRPDPPAKLLEAHRAELDIGRKIHGRQVVLIGKSMGGRMGCHLALTEPVAGVICLGYPLRGMGKTKALRDQVLLDLKAPTLFVQGTRDSLCPLEELQPVLKKRAGESVLWVVPTGDHSLVPTKTYLKSEGITERELQEQTMTAIGDFLAGLPRADDLKKSTSPP